MSQLIDGSPRIDHVSGRSAEQFKLMQHFNETARPASPHLRSSMTTRRVMGDVLIALLPALIGSCYFFGFGCLLLVLVSVLSALLSSFLWSWGRKRSYQPDLSEVVTGVLLAMNLPPTAPLYLPVIGAAFAIIVVKECFGGLGHNVMNPALAARVMLVICFSAQMTQFLPPTTPFSSVATSLSIMAEQQETQDALAAATMSQEGLLGRAEEGAGDATSGATESTDATSGASQAEVDGVSGATEGADADSVSGATDAISGGTQLAVLSAQGYLSDQQLLDDFLGAKPGALGETSVLLLLLGFVYLLWRKVISFRIPLAIWAAMAVMAFLFGGERIANADYSVVLGHLFNGGAMLGAIFMATDYATSPQSPRAQWVFGALCGILVMILRIWGDYAEGMSYAILIMNAFVPLLDRCLRPRVLGEGRRAYA